MQADLTRDTFDPTLGLRRVIMQQGRVEIDANFNEQVSIDVHYLETLAADLIGPHGGPPAPSSADPPGFVVTPDAWDVTLSPGRYYVDGILCENSSILKYSSQPDLPGAPGLRKDGGATYLFFLDVWERHLTFLQAPHIREVALGSPDTATRSVVVYQLRAWPNPPKHVQDGDPTQEDQTGLEALAFIRSKVVSLSDVTMAARTISPDPTIDPCVIPPSSGFRGLENQLYRVEIHYGTVHDPLSPAPSTIKQPTVKFSRENASVVFPIVSIAESVVTVGSLGRDDRLGLEPGDWVEVIDDAYTLTGEGMPLRRVEKIDRSSMTVTLDAAPVGGVGNDPKLHPYLRRWDQTASEAVKLVDGTLPVTLDQWLPLEDGIQVKFKGGPQSSYRSGDFWQIPARVATEISTGDIEWPPPGSDTFAEPSGVRHHVAPLAAVAFDVAGSGQVTSYRRTFTGQAQGA